MKRILIVADVSNLFYCISKKFAGGRLDYAKYKELAVQNEELYKAIAYGAQMGTEAEKFQAALRHMGWIVNFKTPSVFPGANEGEETRKADWDVGIAVDVVKMIKRFDRLVLGSADGDMVPLVQWVQDQGAEVHVFATGISRQLRMAADSYEEITSDLLIPSKELVTHESSK